MNRLEIRTLARTLMDEPDAAPDGSFADADIDIQINASKDRVAIALSSLLPGKFRSYALVDVEAGKASYSIVTDFAVTDCLLPVDFYRYKADERRLPLLYTPNSENLALVSNKANLDSVLWGQEKDGYVEFSPPAKETVASRYKFIYVKKWPDLTHDTSDVAPNVATPGYDSVFHSLIAYDVAVALLPVNERSTTDLERRRDVIMQEVAWNLTGQSGARFNELLSTRRILHLGASL
jgi:hypothetical protein